MSTGEYLPWMPRKDDRTYAPETIALSEAIAANDILSVRELISKGAPLDAVMPHGHRPLTLAATLGHVDVLSELITAGADINGATVAGGAAIHCANDARTLDVLLDAGVDVNARGSRGESALFCAVGGEAVRLSPLLRAGWGRLGSHPLVETLIRRGADVNLPDAHGATALMAAAELFNLSVLRLLINSGAKLDMQDKNGSTALMRAAFGKGKKRLQIVHALVEAGANVNAQRPDGMTALRYACWEGDAPMVAALVHAGADVNLASDLGEGPIATLVHNAPKDRLKMAKVLLRAGADPNARISDKHPDPGRRAKSARDLATDRRDKKMFAILDELSR